jgi:hypothetical protein
MFVIFRKYRFLLWSCLFFLYLDCNKSVGDECFEGTIQIVEAPDKISKVELKKIQLEDEPYTGNFAVYDSLIIFRIMQLPDHFFSIFNLHSGRFIGNFCEKGNGPEEFVSVGDIFQLYEENNEIKTILVIPPLEKLAVWNITQSVNQQRTVYDTIVHFPIDKEHNYAPYLYAFRLNPQEVMVYLQGVFLTSSGDQALPPCYQKREIFTGKLIKNYDLYTGTVHNDNKIISTSSYYNSIDCIKPDGTKIVQGMSLLSQINILEIDSAKYSGYRMKGTPDFSVLYTDNKDVRHYYGRIQADNQYIYALYSGNLLPSSPQEPYQFAHHIHVFDWDGKFVRILDVNYPIRSMWLDTLNGVFYFIDAKTDDLYYCALTEFNLESN